jgi:hypothetical protein
MAFLFDHNSISKYQANDAQTSKQFIIHILSDTQRCDKTSIDDNKRTVICSLCITDATIAKMKKCQKSGFNCSFSKHKHQNNLTFFYSIAN